MTARMTSFGGLVAKHASFPSWIAFAGVEGVGRQTQVGGPRHWTPRAVSERNPVRITSALQRKKSFQHVASLEFPVPRDKERGAWRVEAWFLVQPNLPTRREEQGAWGIVGGGSTEYGEAPRPLRSHIGGFSGASLASPSIRATWSPICFGHCVWTEALWLMPHAMTLCTSREREGRVEAQFGVA